MMDGNTEDAVSAVMEFLGVIDSVYSGLVVMPFLVLNDMFSFPLTTFFYSKDRLLQQQSFDCKFDVQKTQILAWVTWRSLLRDSVYLPAKMGMMIPASQGHCHWEPLLRRGHEVVRYEAHERRFVRMDTLMRKNKQTNKC